MTVIVSSLQVHSLSLEILKVLMTRSPCFLQPILLNTCGIHLMNTCNSSQRIRKMRRKNFRYYNQHKGSEGIMRKFLVMTQHEELLGINLINTKV